MKRIGLNFDEFVELRFRPPAGMDCAGPGAEPAGNPPEQMFPMTVTVASDHLRLRGYACRPAMLEMLMESETISPAKPDAWAQADVEAAAQYFERCDILTPYTAMCQTLGCTYADFLRSLREAAERESVRYGRRVPQIDQYFVMHRVPPRGGADGHPAIISFTLADDIRERLERGEDV